jgi:two-component sensor histidine kinase
MKRSALFLLTLCCCFHAFTQTDFGALTDKGYQQLSDGKSASAKQTLEQALKVLPKDLAPESKADFFNNLGVAYYQTGDYKKGLDAYELSLNTYRKLKNDSLVAGALLNLGLAYKEIGAFKQATSVITQAARLSERYGNQQELSAAWNAIGNIQRETGNYVKALQYHRRALHIRNSIGYNKGTADSYHNIGTVYLEWKRYDLAEKYLLEALKRKKMLSNQSNTVNTLSVLGRLYVAKQAPQKALFYLNSAYEMRQEAGNSAKAAASLYYLGTYYASIGDRSKALVLYRQVQDLARSANDHLLLAYALMSEINLLKSSTGNDPLLDKYQELVETRERGAIDENRKEMARLEIEYDVERKEREIEMRRKQAKLDRIRIENDGLRNQQLVGWIIGLSLLVSIVSVLFYQIRRRKKYIEVQNRELEEQRDEITHLHQELSHRTKNYFGLLSGILKSDKLQVKHPEATKVLEENIRRLEAMSLVQKYLLDDSTHQNKEVQLDTYLNNVIDLVVLNLFPQENKLKLVREIDAIYLDYDIAMRLAIALNELICNAIEHGLLQSETPELTVSVKRSEQKLELIVRDNGPGFTEQHLQANSINGQGLIVKLLHKVNGAIRYSNDHGCVATVHVDL